ncbi:MAG: radical SAM protein [Terracidiphilus sp.]|jgi:radical SAM protein with 4Fe4S-binding SPASM domain
MDVVRLDMVAVHFSTRCGSACPFCYFSDSIAQRQAPTAIETIDRILRKIAADGVKEVLFVGGDPVIHPGFITSLEIAKQVGLTTSVLSNSWAIRPIEALNRVLSFIDYCEATVLGATAETHDALTQRPGSFRNLMNNLSLIAQAGKKVGVCANATPQNLHEIYSIVKMMRDSNIPVRSLMIQRIVPSGDAKGSFKYGLNLGDVQTLMDQVDRVSVEFEIPIQFEDPVPWCTVEPKYHKYLSKCQWGYTRGSINSEGMLNRCGADDSYRLGSIWNGNLQELWINHPILRSFRSKQYLGTECRDCILLEKCGGGCPLSCGTMTDHSFDNLYLQRINGASGSPIEERGNSKSLVSVRFAVDQDLPSIVRSESAIFGNNSPVVFNEQAIELYFRRCPQAFRVAHLDGSLVGYSAVFPIVSEAIKHIECQECQSVNYMPIEFVGTNFSSSVAALFLEVIAVQDHAPFSVKLELFKDLVCLFNRYSVSVYTSPVSVQGSEIAERAGFKQIRDGSRLYVRPAPLVVVT